MNAQELINEAEGLTFDEKTPLLLSKLAKGELMNNETNLHKEFFEAFSLGRQATIDEILDFINKERDNGNCEGGGFSAGICLADLIKKLTEIKNE